MAVIRQTRALSAGPWRGGRERGRSFPSGIQVELTSRREVAAFFVDSTFSIVLVSSCPSSGEWVRHLFPSVAIGRR
jgi:hypothetical protein